MDARPSFRFWFAVGSVALLLILVDLLLWALAAGLEGAGAFGFVLSVICPATGLLMAACVVLYLIGWLNRRDDPQYARRPPDDP